jgi:amino acid transporter
MRSRPNLPAAQTILRNTDAWLDDNQPETKGKNYIMVIIMWTITVMMILQIEIGLVSSNTMTWLALILIGITFFVGLVNFIRRRKVTRLAEISRRVGLIKPTVKT